MNFICCASRSADHLNIIRCDKSFIRTRFRLLHGIKKGSHFWRKFKRSTWKSRHILTRSFYYCCCCCFWLLSCGHFAVSNEEIENIYRDRKGENKREEGVKWKEGDEKNKKEKRRNKEPPKNLCKMNVCYKHKIHKMTKRPFILALCTR